MLEYVPLLLILTQLFIELWKKRMCRRRFLVSAFWKRTIMKSGTYSVNKSHSHSRLSESEMLNGCRLGLDSHADVTCVGRHARSFQFWKGISAQFIHSMIPMNH